MQINVIDIMQQQQKQSQPQQLESKVFSLSGLTNIQKKQKVLKSQTVQDLHQAINKNQIVISKNHLKELMARKQSQQNSQSQINNDDMSSSNYEMSFNNQIQVPQHMSQANTLQSSVPYSLQNIMENLDYKHMFLSEQQQELTPMVGSKAMTQQVMQGPKPTDSLKSLKSGLPMNISNVSRSREDLVFKTQDRQSAENLISIDQNFQQQLNEYRSVTNLQTLNQNQNIEFRSRSGSIEKRSKSNKKKMSKPLRSSKKNPLVDAMSPVRKNSAEKKLSIGQFGSGANAKEASGSKNKKLFRKGSAGLKRNQVPPHAGTIKNVQSSNNKVIIQQQEINQLNQRPRSANVQKLSVIDMIQQQKIKMKSQQEKVIAEIKNNAAITVQKSLKQYLAKLYVISLKQEKKQIELNLKLVQERYWQKNDTLDSGVGLIKSVDHSMQRQISPIKLLRENRLILPDTSQSHQQMQFSNNIHILEEELKEDRSRAISNSSKSSYLDKLPNKLSKSEINLKQLVAQQAERLKKQSRPNSSDINKQRQTLTSQQNKQETPSESDNQSQKLSLQQLQQNFNEKLDQQKALNQRHLEQVQNMLVKVIDSDNSLQRDDEISGHKDKNLPRQNNSVNTYELSKRYGKEIKGKNLGQQFDALISSNKLSGDIDFGQNLQQSNRLDESRVRGESFLLNIINDHQNRQPSQKNQNVSTAKSLLQLNKKDDNQQTPNVQNPFSNSQVFELEQSYSYKHHQNRNFNNMINNSNNSKLDDYRSMVDDNVSWNFDKKSFQDYFEPNSQILMEESKRMSIKGLSTPGMNNTQSGSKHQSKFNQKINQYEEVLDIMTKKTEKGKEELRKLQEKKHLSPASKKRMDSLEKWVTKQEEQINIRRNWINENVNDLISKMDQELKMTKQKIGSGRKQGSSFRFNASMELSKYDMSIAHFTSSSIQSTPRTVQNAQTTPIVVNNTSQNSVTPVANGGGVSPHIQQQQPYQISGFEQQMTFNEANKQQSQYRKPFEYKIPTKNINSVERQPYQVQPLEEQKSHTQPFEKNKQEKSLVQAYEEVRSEIQILSMVSEVDQTPDQQHEYNVFAQNLADQESQIKRSSTSFSQHQQQPDQRLRDSEIFCSTSQLEDDEAESLSKMEPPQFQSPTLSAISPNQQLRDEDFNDDVDKHAPMPPPFGSDYKELHISPLSPEGNYEDQSQLQESHTKLQSDPELNVSEKKAHEEQEQLADAFLALKEPEQTLSFDQAKSMREMKQEQEAQTEILTEYILSQLVDQLKYNLFPKRPVIALRTPSKDQEIEFEEVKEPQPHDIIEEPVLPQTLENPLEEQIHEPNIVASSLPPQPVNEIQILPNKKKIRGIKTSMRIVDSYSQQIFNSVRSQQDEFIENLSTPLNKDPLEILLHLQNVYLDSDVDLAMNFQQSVLPVDLYLELERNKQGIQIAEPTDEEQDMLNTSMLGEWENIHNKVIFDAINEALDNYRPYGLRGPPMPWSQQTRTLTYRNGQEVETVLRQVRVKVMEWARTFAGALPCSELLQEYGIRGPLDEDKLNLLREERLALVLAAEIEENEQLWTDYEYEETQTKLDVADMILEFLTEEVAKDVSRIQEKRQQEFGNSQTENTTNATSLQFE